MKLNKFTLPLLVCHNVAAHPLANITHAAINLTVVPANLTNQVTEYQDTKRGLSKESIIGISFMAAGLGSFLTVQAGKKIYSKVRGW